MAFSGCNKILLISILAFFFLTCSYCSKKHNPYIPEPFKSNDYALLPLTDDIDPYNYDYILSLYLPPPVDENNIVLFQYKNTNYYHHVLMANRIIRYLHAYKCTNNIEYLNRSVVYANKIMTLKVDYKDAYYLPYQFTINAHASPDNVMEAPWYSGMTQGVALSAFVRLYKITSDVKYLDFAIKLFASFKNYDKNQTIWTVFIDDSGYYWIEEYPNPIPDRVLNGFIFAIYGLYDYYELTKDNECKQYLIASLTTIEKYIEQYRNEGGVSCYCLKHRHTDPHYHIVHCEQLTALYKITGHKYFQTMAEEFYNDYHE